MFPNTYLNIFLIFYWSFSVFIYYFALIFTIFYNIFFIHLFYIQIQIKNLKIILILKNFLIL